MTPPDHDPTLDDGPLDDDTLAVNAVVDDEATAEQRRRVARDPELVARVADLRAAAAAVAAPVETLGADVLAALRARALDALDEADDDIEDEDEDADDPGEGPAPAAEPVLPVRDLGAARARRSRSLPPLPAVAAVVVLLVLVGVGLIVAGSSGKSDSSADGAGVAAEGGGSDDEATAGGDSGAATDGADAQQELEEEFSERPADEVRDDLLARATARYATDAELVDELEGVDVLSYSLAGGTGAPATSDDEGDASTTTSSAPATTAVPAPDEASSAARSARAFAADPVATRCDDVLRSAEPDLDPATTAVLVEIDGVPVLVLSNPTEVTDRAPEGIRFTVLNAVDCSPRAAVLR